MANNVTLYFDETDTRIEAVQHAIELGLDPSEVRLYPLGVRQVYGIPIKADPEFSTKYQKEYINRRSNEDKDIIRRQRCLIPGDRQYLKRCPESISCKSCPNIDKKPSALSVEQSIALYGDMFKAFDEMSVQTQIELRETIEEAYRIKPKEVRAFLLANYEGCSASEITDLLGVTERTVRRYVVIATELIKDIFFATY